MELALIFGGSLILTIAIFNLFQPDGTKEALDQLAREPEELREVVREELIEVNRIFADAVIDSIYEQEGEQMGRHDYVDPYAVATTPERHVEEQPEWVQPKGRTWLEDFDDLTGPEQDMLRAARANLLTQEAHRRVNDSARRQANGIAMDSAEIEIDTVVHLHDVARRPYHPDDEAYVWSIIDETVKTLRPVNRTIRDVGMERMGELAEERFSVQPDSRRGWKKFLGVR